jgi:hypothetical protein
MIDKKKVDHHELLLKFGEIQTEISATCEDTKRTYEAFAAAFKKEKKSVKISD